MSSFQSQYKGKNTKSQEKNFTNAKICLTNSRL
uniref:Uncharacterized protein n=1 Tax=Myoviridae sp. ctuIn11 TaxID=2827715 RepID=A0A8S5SHQ6_9CAUD|nr:MAG TPA: hypothetical protein [Myoviridae sp. ctuIn11]